MSSMSMSESFADLFEQSIEKSNVHLGSIVEGTVVRINNEYVTISSADSKSEGEVPLE